MQGPYDAYRNAIGTVESSNNYGAVGPATRTGDHAYGRYQVMGANIPSWTQAALGEAMTPQDFLKNQDAQDRVFDHHFGAAMQKHGSADDAASVWFSGRPMSQAGNSSDGYNTVPQYVSKFRRALGDGGAPMASAFADTKNNSMNPMQAAYAQQGQGQGQGQYAYDQSYDPNAGIFSRLKAAGPGALFGAPHGVFPGANGNPGYDLGTSLQKAGAWAMSASNPSALGALGAISNENSRKFVQIGTDEFGNPRYGFVDEKRGSITPAGGQGQQGAGGGAQSGNAISEALSSGKTGEDLLAHPGVPASAASMVRGIANGIQPYNAAALMRTPQGRMVDSLLQQYEPGADYVSRLAGAKDWAAKSNEITRRAGQAARHGSEMVDTFSALHNTDYPLANTIKNGFDEATGGGAPGAARLNVTAFANEMGALVRGNGGSDASFNEWAKNFPVNGSPEQQRAALGMAAKLFRDSKEELEQKRVRAIGPAQAQAKGPLFTPQVEAALSRMEDFAKGGSKAQKMPTGVSSIKLISQ